VSNTKLSGSVKGGLIGSGPSMGLPLTGILKRIPPQLQVVYGPVYLLQGGINVTHRQNGDHRKKPISLFEHQIRHLIVEPFRQINGLSGLGQFIDGGTRNGQYLEHIGIFVHDSKPKIQIMDSCICFKFSNGC
jgi:hypothetical protein